MLDPVRGFDQLADIIAASIGLACLADTSSPVVREALIQAWLGLQNATDKTFETVAAYVPSRPDAFLDVAELPRDRLAPTTREQSLTGLLIFKRDHPAVEKAVTLRAHRWLGLWSRFARVLGRDEGQQERQSRHEAHVDKALAMLTPAETEQLRKLTTQVPALPELTLDRLAAQLMAARPQVAYADGLLGWGLAAAIAGDYPNGEDELAWSIRLNDVDWRGLYDALHAALDDLGELDASAMRSGAARALRILGDAGSATRADALSPLTFYPGWSRSNQFCNTDAFDPGAPVPTNLENARNAVARTEPSSTWLHMSSTGEDHDLEEALPGLVRHDPAPLLDRFRSIVAGAPDRTGLALRQLGWRLPWLSPLFGDVESAAIGRTLESLRTSPERLPADDLHWVAGQMIEALQPHVDAEAQLRLLLDLPLGAPLYLNLRRALKPLSAERLEACLIEAVETPDDERLRRTLFHASGSRANLTPRSRTIVADAVFSEDSTLSWSAGDTVTLADDAELDELIIERARWRNCRVDEADEGYARARAIAQAVVRRRRVDQVDAIPARFLGPAAAELGEPVLDRLADTIEVALERLRRPIVAEAPPDIANYRQTSRDDLDAVAWLEEAPDQNAQDPHRVLEEIANAETSGRAYAARQRAALEQVQAYRRALAAEGADVLLLNPPRDGVRRLADRRPDRVADWLRALSDIQGPTLLRQVRNLGLTIAAAGARIDPERAVALLQRLKVQRGAVNIVVGDARVPLYLDLIFATPSDALDRLRRETFDLPFDDEALEVATVAAEAAGATDWLDGYLEELQSSVVPGRRARAITVTSFRRAAAHQSADESTSNGFLGNVLTAANRTARAAAGARHWFALARSADTSTEYWRYAQLAEGGVDRRLIAELDEIDLFESAAEPFRLHGPATLERLRKAAEKRSAKRKETLFGTKAPTRDLLVTLSDRLTP